MNKKIIVIWSSSGLWFETSKKLLGVWYEVIWVARRKTELGIESICCDLTKDDQIKKLATQISELDNVSAIILCAWNWYIEKRDEVDFEHVNEIFQLNLLSQIKLISFLLPFIKSNDIDIVDIGATIGYKPNEWMSTYSISKYWLRWLIENLRLELKWTASRVIGIHPGGMNTESNIWINGREVLVAEKTWKTVATSLIDTESVANLVVSFLELPKNIEISEVIINRK